jgi:hypothetical protein
MPFPPQKALGHDNVVVAVVVVVVVVVTVVVTVDVTVVVTVVVDDVEHILHVFLHMSETLRPEFPNDSLHLVFQAGQALG